MKKEQSVSVERRMRFMPRTIDPDDSVVHARALLDEQRINQLPVVSNGRLIGIVSRYDLKTRSSRRRALRCAKRSKCIRTAFQSTR
jgi:CBS domain-containing protein